MSAVTLQEIPQSPGVWASAWKRLKADRVGMVSLAVTLLFILMVLLAYAGVLARDWQKEVGTPFAPPHFVGKIVDGSQTAIVEGASGPNAISLDLAQISGIASGELAFSYRYLQPLEQPVKLPAGFAPARVTVELVAARKGVNPVRESFLWTVENG